MKSHREGEDMAKSLQTTVVLFLLTCLFGLAPQCLWAMEAASASALRELDTALKAVSTFEHGKDSTPLVLVEKQVMEAAKKPAERAAVEERLLSALDSAATRDARSFLCRQLRTIGTARSVPHLEKLLADPESSHMARYALGSMEDPAAAAALHRALRKTSGTLRIGIVNTLGDRAYAKALPDIAALLRSSDPGVAVAAARALGRIGGTEAVKVLETARPASTGALRQCIDNALLIAAEQFLAGRQAADAGRIYMMFFSSAREKRLRLAGLRGIVAAGGERAAPVLVEAIRRTDEELRRAAIGLTTTVQGRNATEMFVALLPSLPAQDQALLLKALGSRGDAGALRAAAAATKSEDETVRVAALEALGTLGDHTAALFLAKAAAEAGGNEKRIAQASLVRLRGAEVDAALAQSLASGDAKVRIEVIHALVGRDAGRAVGALLQTAGDNDESVRREAIRAVGALASESELGALVALAVSPKDAGDRPAIEAAIEAAFRRIENAESRADAVIAALARAPTTAQPTLVRLLGKAATSKALDMVRAALRARDAGVREAAVRTLSEWPNAGPAEDLLVLARTSASEAEKGVALRGYVRMAGLSENPTSMYVRAMELAKQPEEKKLVLAGLGAAGSDQAMKIVEPYLKDEGLREAAAGAAVQIADRLRQRDAARARAVLDNVLSIVQDSRTRQGAKDIINEMEQYEGYILDWYASGPYTGKAKDGQEAFDTVFEPEKPEAQDVKWAALTRGIGSWDINLETAFGSRDHVAAYVRTRVLSPAAQEARLELGSDDALKVWLNGELVHGEYRNRGLSPRQDIVKVKLREGWNDLLLKVVDHEGGWAFCCRVRQPDGGAIEGLKVEAK
jgi:HEAT repeat protein